MCGFWKRERNIFHDNYGCNSKAYFYNDINSSNSFIFTLEFIFLDLPSDIRSPGLTLYIASSLQEINPFICQGLGLHIRKYGTIFIGGKKYYKVDLIWLDRL